MQTAIAEPAALAGQFNQSCLQLLVLWLHFRFVMQDRARQTHQQAGTALGNRCRFTHHHDRLTLLLGAQRFRPKAAFSASASRIDSASSRLSLAFSASRSFSLLASGTDMPPNFARQL